MIFNRVVVGPDTTSIIGQLKAVEGTALLHDKRAEKVVRSSSQTVLSVRNVEGTAIAGSDAVWTRTLYDVRTEGVEALRG